MGCRCVVATSGCSDRSWGLFCGSQRGVWGLVRGARGLVRVEREAVESGNLIGAD